MWLACVYACSQEYDAEVAAVLNAHQVDLVLCIGYMRILSRVMVDRFAWRMLNVHPSLLPEFAGGMDLDVHSAVLAAGHTRTGCTVHFVEAAVDAGAILVQRAVEVEAGETADSLKAKVQAEEGKVCIDIGKVGRDWVIEGKVCMGTGIVWRCHQRLCTH